jgi:hypothetical protein
MLVDSGLKHLPETVSQNPHFVFLVGDLSFQRQAVGENLLAHAEVDPGPCKLKARFTLSRYTVIVNVACTFVSCSSALCHLQFERTKAIIGE